MKRNRKKTIFKLFLIPLTVVMLIQGGISFSTLILTKASGALREYSVGMMYKTVENRSVILQNDMVQRWTAINGRTDSFQQSLEELMKRNNLSIDEFLASEEAQKEYLEDIIRDCVGILRNNTTTGLFVVLANEDIPFNDGSCNGFYIRDADPSSNPNDLSDLLMERGNKELSRNINIPLDSYWSTDFHLSGEGERMEDDFFINLILQVLRTRMHR
ncbi:MAG: hypothetical protein Q4D16_02245 [Eubacteriales bacterium]|nr:hypothetical protein [Eubacteriales bacterium]